MCESVVAGMRSVIEGEVCAEYSRRWGGNRCDQSGSLGGVTKVSENPRAHKNKIGTPPQNPREPPPPTTRNFMDMEVFLQKANIPGVHKIDAPISDPRIVSK